jgi:hypothetical protein
MAPEELMSHGGALSHYGGGTLDHSKLCAK